MMCIILPDTPPISIYDDKNAYEFDYNFQNASNDKKYEGIDM